MRSLVGDLLRTTFAILVLVLVTVGLATGALLYLQAHRALDSELLAVARARGSGEIEPGQWDTEHAQSPVHVRMLAPGDPLLPAGWAENAEDLELPEWRDDGDDRMLLLPVERGPEDGEEHAMLVATAPRVTVMGSAGRFALAYAVVAGFAALLGGLLQEHLLLLAVEPIQAARGAVSRVMGAGVNARVDERGPIEVVELLHAVNGLLDRLEQAFAAQSRFTSEAAHELRSPITVMLGELDVALRRERAAPEYVDVLRSTREEVGRLAALVEGLLVLARVDSGQAEQGRVTLTVQRLVDEVVARDDVRRGGGTLTVDLGEVAAVELDVHPALMTSALSNLLRNAAVHAPGAPVHFAVTATAEQVQFAVEDAGPGVPEDRREAAFDRLARARGVREAGAGAGGLGLGLPLAREIARRHGGDCVLESASSGTGCRAVLTVRRAARSAG